MYTPDQLHDSIETIYKLGKEYGRDMSSFVPGVFVFASTHANGDKAKQMCSDKLSKQYNQDFSKLIGKYALAGTPEECQKRLKEYVDAGAKMVVLPSACAADYVDENTELLAKEVMPAFR